MFNECLMSHNITPITTYSKGVEINLERSLTNFVTWGYLKKRWSCETILSRLSGIKFHLKQLKFTIPDLMVTQEVLTGLTKEQNRVRNNKIASGQLDFERGAKALPPLAVAVGMDVYNKTSDGDQKELAVAQLTAFWLLLRASEICTDNSESSNAIKNITVGCVRFLQLGAEVSNWNDATSLTVFIPNPKSRSGEGGLVSIPRGDPDRMELVSALGKYMEDRNYFSTTDPSQPLFPNTTRSRLTKFMRKCARTALGDSDLGNSFSLHSLRHGGATALANSGLPLETLKKHGRWSSDAYKRYVQSGIGDLGYASNNVISWVSFIQGRGSAPTLAPISGSISSLGSSSSSSTW